MKYQPFLGLNLKELIIIQIKPSKTNVFNCFFPCFSTIYISQCMPELLKADSKSSLHRTGCNACSMLGSTCYT